MWSSVYHPVRKILIILAAFLFDSAQVSWMLIKAKIPRRRYLSQINLDRLPSSYLFAYFCFLLFFLNLKSKAERILQIWI